MASTREVYFALLLTTQRSKFWAGRVAPPLKSSALLWGAVAPAPTLSSAYNQMERGPPERIACWFLLRLIQEDPYIISSPRLFAGTSFLGQALQGTLVNGVPSWVALCPAKSWVTGCWGQPAVWVLLASGKVPKGPNRVFCQLSGDYAVGWPEFQTSMIARRDVLFQLEGMLVPAMGVHNGPRLRHACRTSELQSSPHLG